MESTDMVLIMELDSDHQSEVLDQLQLLDILAIIKTMYFLKIGTKESSWNNATHLGIR